MMVAAKKISQATTHMAIAFSIMFFATGSVAFGGLAALLEPIINVALLPPHQRLWAAYGLQRQDRQFALGLAEKISQFALHFIVAFSVMYWATGSLAFGGFAAILEPLLNVLVLPYHDRLWDDWQARRVQGYSIDRADSFNTPRRSAAAASASGSC